jgi:cytochrome c biogenesis protein CcmG, thiol:disulfide interchange protein DsbE
LRVGVAIGLFVAALTARTEEKFTVLTVGDESYTNVTVTSVTATDIYFSHARGMGNAKLKDLAPALQKHFGYDRKKAGEAERQKRASSWEYRVALATAKPVVRVSTARGEPPEGAILDEGDLVVTNLLARSFRGQRPPQIFVDEWLTQPPDVTGKFVLIEFWRSSSEPCRDAIPHLNNLQAKYKDRLVVIGLSDEPVADVQKITSPRIEYSVGTDTEAKTLQAIEVRAIPHAILIDPKDIVRFEGVPGYLDEDMVDHLIAKYSN